MFHDIKSASLIGPWQGMCDRAVKMYEFEFEAGQAYEAVALAEHIEVLALHRIHARRMSFQERYDQHRGTRPRRGALD